tara:strand:+ start:9302 stop:10291 length:990 start_codon:yes stop_codon:yes gene_type:complete
MIDYQNKKILITGGLGFIGSNLARKLLKLGAKVTLVDNLDPLTGGNQFNIEDIKDQLTINIFDIRENNELKNVIESQDLLFNLAAQTSHIGSMLDPKKDLEVNLIAQLSLLEICKKINPDIKIVYASTRQLYGSPNYLPVDENHHVQPLDINGINKFAGECYHLLYNNVYGINSCCLRLTNTYGPGMRVIDARQTFLGIWVRNLLEKKPIEVYGTGQQLRDFNYIDDCVNAFLIVGINEKANGKVYNLGSKEVLSLENVAKKMSNLVPNSSYNIVPFPNDRKAIDIGDYYSNFSLISSELQWEPKISLNEGLKKTIEYYKMHFSNYCNV